VHLVTHEEGDFVPNTDMDAVGVDAYPPGFSSNSEVIFDKAQCIIRASACG